MNANNTAILPTNDKLLVIRDSILNLVGFNHVTAAFVNQIIYWRERMDRQFYKTDEDFAKELHISIHKFRRIKAAYIKPLPFIKITLKGVPARTHYEVDFDMLNEILAAQNQTNALPTPPDTLPDSPPPQVTDNHSMRKGAQSSISASAQSITENTPEITKKITTEINPVVVNLGIFKEQEQSIAKKILTSITEDQQVAVLAVMMVAIKSSTVKNKLGYLRAIVNSVLSGTFTPVTKSAAPPSAKDRLILERKRKEEEEQRHKISNADFFKEISDKFGKTKTASDNTHNTTLKSKLSGVNINRKS